MLEKRADCCAVVAGNKIVVMGGENEKNETLNTVECLTKGDSKWEYLPAMNEARWGAVAEALPDRGLEREHYDKTSISSTLLPPINE
jgi:hypothetical protein